jgi:hypothetical protein
MMFRSSSVRRPNRQCFGRHQRIFNVYSVILEDTGDYIAVHTTLRVLQTHVQLLKTS